MLRQNNYDMETGELSVYQRELADAPGAEQAAPSQGKRRGGAQVRLGEAACMLSTIQTRENRQMA